MPMGLVNIKCLIILHISSSSILKDDSLVSVIYVWFSGNLLPFGKGLHWDEKYLLERLAFSLKFVIIFPFTERGGIIGIFLPLKHNLIIDQYVLGLICELFSFTDKS